MGCGTHPCFHLGQHLCAWLGLAAQWERKHPPLVQTEDTRGFISTKLLHGLGWLEVRVASVNRRCGEAPVPPAQAPGLSPSLLTCRPLGGVWGPGWPWQCSAGITLEAHQAAAVAQQVAEPVRKKGVFERSGYLTEPWSAPACGCGVNLFSGPRQLLLSPLMPSPHTPQG